MFDPRPHLDRLESIIDLRHCRACESLQLSAGDFLPSPRRPTIITCHDSMRHIQYDWPPEWPRFPRSEIVSDPAKMLLSELTWAYEGALIKDDRVLTIRADYGAVIVASILGCKYVEQGEEMPWTQHLPSLDDVERLLEAEEPNPHSGLGAKVLETEKYFLETLSQYEKLSQVVRIGCPDTQGPFNLAASIIGSSIYYTVVDTPQIVHRLLQRITDVSIKFIREHKYLIGEPKDRFYQMGWLVRGGARVVDDSAINLSAGMYQEFCVPYNQQIGKAFGGFLGHFCGRGSHILPALIATPGIRAINFGNPEMQDWHMVWGKAKDAHVCVLWDGDPPPEEEGNLTGIIHKRFVQTREEALTLAEEIIS